jgi:heterodisulfide reductase subunit C
MNTKESSEIVEVDSGFKYRLSGLHGAENLMHCIQCGTCTSDCPVGQRVKEFRPRQIARLALFGLKDLLFSGETLWLCSQCYTCYERCPQEVRPTEVITALRTIAVKEGHLPGAFKTLVETIGNLGRIYEITEFEDEIRDSMGLPKLPEINIEEIKTVMKTTGLDKLIDLNLEEG